MDDMVAKTMEGGDHCGDLEFNMRLNMEKRAFGVRGGKFLGLLLTSRGIEANPKKCRAILEIKIPNTIKEVH